MQSSRENDFCYVMLMLRYCNVTKRYVIGSYAMLNCAVLDTDIFMVVSVFVCNHCRGGEDARRIGRGAGRQEGRGADRREGGGVDREGGGAGRVGRGLPPSAGSRTAAGYARWRRSRRIEESCFICVPIWCLKIIHCILYTYCMYSLESDSNGFCSLLQCIMNKTVLDESVCVTVLLDDIRIPQSFFPCHCFLCIPLPDVCKNFTSVFSEMRHLDDILFVHKEC